MRFSKVLRNAVQPPLMLRGFASTDWLLGRRMDFRITLKGLYEFLFAIRFCKTAGHTPTLL
jgi:hypothetical protein